MTQRIKNWDQLLKDLNLPPESSGEGSENSGGAPQKFFVLVTCHSEPDQLAKINKFMEEGLTCKALIG